MEVDMSSSKMTPDLSRAMDPSGKSVFDVIVEEHRVVDQLYQQFLGSSDLHEKQAIAHNVIKLLSQHAACEEMALYPVIKLKLPNGAQMVQQALQEHLLVKRELFDIDSMLVGQSGYDDKFSQCLNDLLLHVKEEEEQLLPALAQACTPQEVQEMTMHYVQSKALAPTRPHPDAPNEPPTNKAANAIALTEDQVRDAGRFSSA